MHISENDLAQMLDHSKLDPYVTEKQIKDFCNQVKKYNFIAAFVLPANLKIMIDELKKSPVKIGTGIGFPFGTSTTSIKQKECEEAIEMGADELDVVINIGALKSKNYDYVYKELGKLVNTVSPLPLKVILEVSYLNPEEIKKGTEISCRAGVDFVKTGTGFGSRVTTLYDIKLISEVIDSKTKIKAAGGIRDIYTVVEMYKYGVRRFGVSRGPQLMDQFNNEFDDYYEF